MVSSAFNRGFVSACAVFIGGQAGQWLLTPHPDASSARAALVIVQLVSALGAAAWMYLHERRVSAT
ncbi:MAG: hypothetical protein AB7O67_05965 [Vicinamibacterales bacterium]